MKNKKLNTSFEEDSVKDKNKKLLEIQDFIKHLRSLKKGENVYVRLYSDQYSSFSSILKFKVKNKSIEVRRTNWYEDSFWKNKYKVNEFIDDIVTFYVSEANTDILLSNSGWTFDDVGKKNNGFDLEFITENVSEMKLSNDLLNEFGEINIFKFVENYSYSEIIEDVTIADPQKIYIETISNSIEIDIPKLNFKDRVYLENDENDENSVDDAVAELMALLSPAKKNKKK